MCLRFDFPDTLFYRQGESGYDGINSSLDKSPSQDLTYSFMQLHANSRAFWFSSLIFSRLSS